MAAILQGPKPFAIVLCSFNDLPHFPAAREQLTKFITSGGRGGLYDFWRDVSYANIDFTNSEVFGWFTMKYSYARDGNDPDHDGTPGGGRRAWIREAVRLCRESGVDTSRFYGVIAVVNANVDEASDGSRNAALAVGQYYGEGNWRHCKKCEGITFSGTGSTHPCSAGNSHDWTGSDEYRLSRDNDLFAGQDGFKFCSKCTALFSTKLGLQPCPAGGKHDSSGSGSYRIGTADQGYPGQDKWKLCIKCQCLAYTGDGSLGKCAAGGAHDYESSLNYKLSTTNASFNDTFAGHQIGHCLGLSHSWSANPDSESGDPFDIMSTTGVRSFQNGNAPGGEAGPGISAPTLYKLGWIPSERASTYKASTDLPATVNLTALNHPENTGALMARVLSPNHVYTIEFRHQSGWDAGIGSHLVLIHELRSCYTYGQKDWRWCKNCQGLAWNGQARCPAGSLHNYAGSMNYKVAHGSVTFPGQNHWKWCQKCSLLSFSGNPGGAGPCPAGGVHNQNSSADYTLRINDTSASGQPGWKWCFKCQGLSYSLNPSQGTCAAGGFHDHSGSGNYTIPGNDPNAPGDAQWRWCSKCQGLAADGYSHCAVSGLAHDLTQSAEYALSIDDPEYPGQDGWKFCWKCDGVSFASLGAKPCMRGGVHDIADNATLRLMRTVPGLNGQSRWMACNKCQLLSNAGSDAVVPCPAGGNHDHTGSTDYTLANFDDDRTYLIGQGLGPGQEFTDTARNVRIRVDAIDPVAATAKVTIS